MNVRVSEQNLAWCLVCCIFGMIKIIPFVHISSLRRGKFINISQFLDLPVSSPVEMMDNSCAGAYFVPFCLVFNIFLLIL